MRYPAVSGAFYPSNPEKLRRTIEECYLDARGPGKLPKVNPKGPRKIIGAIVPHAGFVYSGAVAAHVYEKIAFDGLPDTFILLGVNHTGLGAPIAVTTEDFSTPFGTVKNNRELSLKLRRNIIEEDLWAHKEEHSIEVQLPFLQYLSEDIKFVPICIGVCDFDSINQLGKILGEMLKDKDVVIIASSDFTHCGFAYQQPVPRTMNAGQYAYAQDKFAIEKIFALDAKGLLDVTEEKNITMCGRAPVSAMLIATKYLGATKAELLKYSTSYDVTQDVNAVGYAGIVVYRDTRLEIC